MYRATSSSKFRVTVMLKYVMLAVYIASAQAQLLANTPGGVRSVPTASDPGGIESAGAACSSSRDPGCSEPPSSEPVIPVELQVLSGQVLFESLFPNLEAISQRDQQSLMSTMMAIHNMTNSVAGGPTAAADSHGGKDADASSTPAAGGANGAVLVAPAITPSEAAGYGINPNPGDLPPLPLPVSDDSFSLPAQTVTPVSHKLPPGIRQPGSVDAANHISDVSSNDSSSDMTSDMPQDVNSMPVLSSSGQSASDVTTAAGTVAATIPVMGQYAQIIVSSLKMLPINADQFSKVSGTGAAALAWEQKVEQGLVKATANATTIPAAQIQAKLTCVLNMALELPEPPPEYAAAAATTIANKIQALTNDSSVLVGVSLVRLGGGGGGSSSNGAAASPTPAAAVSSAWLDTAASYNGSSNGSALISGKSRTLQAAAAAPPGSNSSSGSSNLTVSPSPGSALVLLSIYGVVSPANVVDVAQSLQNNCPGLFKYGSNINSTTCGASIIAAYQSAISPDAAAVASAAGQPASKRILRVTEIGTKAVSPYSAKAGSTGNGSTNSSSHLPAVRLSSAAGSSSSSSNFTVSSIRVRQQPEVNIIVSQAVGITAGQPAADVVLKLQSFSSSFTLPEVLAKYGLSVSQAGVPQIVEIQDSGSAETGSSDTAVPRLDSTSSTAGAGGKNSVVIGVAVAAAVAVAAVSAAAVAIVIVKQRARAAAATAASEANGLPPKKHRKGGKSKGISSRYLPTTFFSPQVPDDAAAACTNTQQACKPAARPTIVAVQLPASLAPLSPNLSPPGELLLPTTGQAAAAAAASVASARASPLLSPLGVRPGPMSTSISPHTSGGAAPVAGVHLTQLTRGDSVSSAVRFDLEVDHSNITAEGSETEEPEDNPVAQHQLPPQLPVARVGPGHSVRLTMVSGSHQAGNMIRDGGGGTSSRASAALPRTGSTSDIQEVPAASLSDTPQGACGSSASSSSSSSSSSRDMAASPEWWFAAADASLALMSAAAQGTAKCCGATSAVGGTAMHQHQHHLSGCSSATCGCCTKDPAHLGVFTRSLSVSSLQVLDAAAAKAAPASIVSGSSSSQGYAVPGTPAAELSLHMLPTTESSGSAQGRIKAHRVWAAMNVKSGIPILNVVCGNQLSSADSSGAIIGSSEFMSEGKLVQPGMKQEQAHLAAQQQQAVVLRPLPKPLLSPFQVAANASFMLEAM